MSTVPLKPLTFAYADTSSSAFCTNCAGVSAAGCRRGTGAVAGACAKTLWVRDGTRPRAAKLIPVPSLLCSLRRLRRLQAARPAQGIDEGRRQHPRIDTRARRMAFGIAPCAPFVGDHTVKDVAPGTCFAAERRTRLLA